LRPARILHAPWNIGGNPLGLSRAERELGFRADVLVFEQHPFGYEADINLRLESWPHPAATVKRGFWALRSLPAYDVFHYNFGQTIYQRLDRRGSLHTELPWLKRMGKRVLVTFQGDDVRPPEANPFAGYDQEGLALQKRFQAPRRDTLLRYADRVFFLNPDLRRWLPGAEFRPYANIDPFSLDPTPLPQGDEIVVAHAPSDRGQKGTALLIEAVDSLRAEGVTVRLDLIEGVPRDEAIERTRRAHLAVDQLNIGWYGGYSVEAMSLGRPVLCHIREEEPGDNPWGDELPIIRTTVETLRDDLRALIGDPERIRRAASEGRSFVERRHDPRRIARQNLEGLVPIPKRTADPPREPMS
jgi:glycosyltransferase involved in cell wall biosynthesis